jgi:hypothetical protein
MKEQELLVLTQVVRDLAQEVRFLSARLHEAEQTKR